jgi:hypothetical protein
MFQNLSMYPYYRRLNWYVIYSSFLVGRENSLTILDVVTVLQALKTEVIAEEPQWKQRDVSSEQRRTKKIDAGKNATYED